MKSTQWGRIYISDMSFALGLVVLTIVNYLDATPLCALLNRIAEVTFGPDRVGLNILGIPGLTYRLERSQDLRDWEVVQRLRVPQDGKVALEDLAPRAGTGFYRVVGE